MGWVSVNKELPEGIQHVLVSVKGSMCGDSQYGAVFFPNENRWYALPDLTVIVTPSHWRARLEPPK